MRANFPSSVGQGHIWPNGRMSCMPGLLGSADLGSNPALSKKIVRVGNAIIDLLLLHVPSLNYFLLVF